MMDVLNVGRSDEEVEAWVAEVVFTGAQASTAHPHTCPHQDGQAWIPRGMAWHGM